MDIQTDLLVVLGGTLLGAFASGLAGFAYALIASAVFLHVLPPREAAVLILLGSSLAQCFTIWRFRAAMDRRRLLPFLLAGIAGVPLGTLALGVVPKELVRDAVGGFLVAYASWALAAPGFRIREAGGRGADAAVGFAGGVLGGVAGLSGALPTVWCGLRGWSRDVQRAVFQPYILAMQLLSFASLAMAGGVGTGDLRRFALTVPAIVLGVLLGMRLYARIDERRFRQVILVLLLASGAALVLS